jgi:hypothetical protein
MIEQGLMQEGNRDCHSLNLLMPGVSAGVAGQLGKVCERGLICRFPVVSVAIAMNLEV